MAEVTEKDRVAKAAASLAPVATAQIPYDHKLANTSNDYSADVPDAKGPTSDQLVQAYADQSGIAPPPPAAAAAPPTPAADPNAPYETPADASPLVKSMDAQPGAKPSTLQKAQLSLEGKPAPDAYSPAPTMVTVDPKTDQAKTEAVPAYADQGGAPDGAHATEADRVAAARQKMTPLDASKSLGAAARLNAPTQGRAVLVSPGGMRPNTEALKVEQGPAVAGADDLLHDIEFQGQASNRGMTDAELARDKDLASIQAANTAGTTAELGQEQKIGQQNSDRLAGVADRMQAAIERSKVPVVSPAQDLNEMGIGQKIAFALAAAGGGIAGRETGTNPFLQGYDDMINARIKTQEAQAKQAGTEVQDQKNLYGVLQDGFKNDDAARTGLRVMYLQALDSKLKEAAIHYNIDSNDARYATLQAGLSQQLLDAKEKLAQLSGQRTSEEQTKKYAPPQVAVVGDQGISSKRLEMRNAIGKELEARGLNKNRDDLDALNSYVANNDKGGVVRKYMDQHPGAGWAQAFADMQKTPEGRQATVDIQHGMQSNFGEKGMRSEGGQALVKAMNDPNLAPQAYNRLAHDTREGIDRVLSPYGPDGYQEWNSMRGTEQDIADAPGSSTTATGSEDLPTALPPPPPSTASNSEAVAVASARKKKADK